MEKGYASDAHSPPTRTRRSLLAPFLVGFIIISGLFTQLSLYRFYSSGRPSTIDRHIDWSWLSHEKQCPALEGIKQGEFTARRERLARLLEGEDATGWGAYITEPSANTLYYLNLTQSNWYLSERPWLVAITPSANSTSHLSILTPSFELSRSQRLPFALSSSEFDQVSWVIWEEADSPYEVLVHHLDGLRQAQGKEGEWSIEIEENVRQFVASGLAEARAKLDGEKPNVGLAKMQVRESRMTKTDEELEIQRCVGKITLAALRAVRKQLRLGMTEKEGETLIVDALKAGGLTDIGAIVLFGENAALPHASAGSRKLQKGEFALFDVDGSLFGYMSDFTRTMLPDLKRKDKKGTTCDWPNARAKKIYETVQRAQRAALEKLLTPNSTDVVYAAQVDQAARKVIADEGWGSYFTHRLGHGIGLEVHEHPYLNSGNTEQVLQPGETFSNEPGIYIEQSRDTEGSGIGVRLEDMVLKTDKGWELISGSDLARSPCDP
ncbi:hypothetical protein JCM5353_007944 [Sporobolomyces roseus]